MVLSRGGALLGALACLASVSLAIPAAASASVTSLTSCQTISMPGTYRLDADVIGQGNCFEIDANNVTLILNGHTITRSGPAANGIDVIGDNAKILGPGTLTEWHNAGIELGGSNAKVRGVTATGNDFFGILITGSGNDVRGSVVTGSLTGIEVFSGVSNTIIGNSAHNNGTDLADLNANCDSNVWIGNDFVTANESCIH
jgi:hypothetical protein